MRGRTHGMKPYENWCRNAWTCLAERARLKLWWLKDKDTAPPLHISDAEWANLKAYWSADAQKIKAQKMTVARRSVRSDALVGRRGRASREARLVRVQFNRFRLAAI